MKKIYSLMFLLIANCTFAQITMAPQDIVVLQVNCDGRYNELAFLTLENIPGNTIFYISDISWNNKLLSYNSGSERGIKVTVNANGLKAGTIIRIDNTIGTQYTLQEPSQGLLEYFELDGSEETSYSRELNLSTKGDQVFIFQTIDGLITSNKSFIYGINTNNPKTENGWGNPSSQTISHATSDIPKELTALNTTQSNKASASAFGIGQLLGGNNTNFQYKGPITEATKDEWLTRIHTLSNWSCSTTMLYLNDNIAYGNLSVTITPSGTLSVDVFKNTTVKIFPNPSFDYIYVAGIEGTPKYTIYNINGKKVDEGKITTGGKIEVTSLTNNNLYFLSLEERQTIKFLKK